MLQEKRKPLRFAKFFPGMERLETQFKKYGKEIAMLEKRKPPRKEAGTPASSVKDQLDAAKTAAGNTIPSPVL
jgi:hypothetical protein